MARLGRQPDEAVFIDDFAHNIVARAVGMQTIHFTPQVDLAALAKLGYVTRFCKIVLRYFAINIQHALHNVAPVILLGIARA